MPEYYLSICIPEIKSTPHSQESIRKLARQSELGETYIQRNTKDLHELPHVWTAQRIRALHRQGKLGFSILYCRCQYCKALKKPRKELIR